MNNVLTFTFLSINDKNVVFCIDFIFPAVSKPYCQWNLCAHLWMFFIFSGSFTKCHFDIQEFWGWPDKFTDGV